MGVVHRLRGERAIVLDGFGLDFAWYVAPTGGGRAMSMSGGKGRLDS